MGRHLKVCVYRVVIKVLLSCHIIGLSLGIHFTVNNDTFVYWK